METLLATLSVERELKDELRVIEYDMGNGNIHFHSQIEICIVESGSVDALINNLQKTLNSGDIAISLSYDSHRYISSNDSKYCVLILPSEICEKFYDEIKNKKFNTPFICDSDRASTIMEYLAHIKKADTDHLVRLGYVYLLLGIIKENMHDHELVTHDDTELLSRLLIYINENYRKRLNLSTISKAFGYHPGYISTYFMTHLNIGISRYINIIRLKNAVVLMQQQKYTITEISMECGFSSTRTFYRSFRHEFQCSPKEYFDSCIHSTD